MHGPELITNLESVAREAGRYLLDISDEDQRESEQKTNRKDFVTVADIKCQEIIVKRLQELYPNIIIVSEESPEAERAPVYEHDFTGFVIDPIDGTFNFKRGMRESAVSIGYIELGESSAGVIYNPYLDELYSAQKDRGAFRNGKKIAVSNNEDMASASVATSNNYNDEGMKRTLQRQIAIFDQTGHMPWMSCPGSAVIIMGNIASGRIDAFHHNSLKPWDNAAAFVLVREAGGVVKTLAGQDATFTSPTVLAGNPKIVEQLEAVFQKVPNLLS